MPTEEDERHTEEDQKHFAELIERLRQSYPPAAQQFRTAGQSNDESTPQPDSSADTEALDPFRADERLGDSVQTTSLASQQTANPARPRRKELEIFGHRDMPGFLVSQDPTPVTPRKHDFPESTAQPSKASPDPRQMPIPVVQAQELSASGEISTRGDSPEDPSRSTQDPTAALLGLLKWAPPASTSRTAEPTEPPTEEAEEEGTARPSDKRMSAIVREMLRRSSPSAITGKQGSMTDPRFQPEEAETTAPSAEGGSWFQPGHRRELTRSDASDPEADREGGVRLGGIEGETSAFAMDQHLESGQEQSSGKGHRRILSEEYHADEDTS